MSEPIAYFNGRLMPISQAALSPFDLGVVAGASATEMIRTFAGNPFQLDQHLARLEQSLSLLEIRIDRSRADLRSLCHQVIEQNYQLISSDQDLGLVVFVTAGQNLTYLGRAAAATAKTPTVCIHTFPLPFELWAGDYESGLHLITTSIKSIPDNVIDPRIKHRNRLHWRLADLQAKQIDPNATAILTDQEGYLTETATGNLCVVEGEMILTPELHVLEGVSRAFVADLAAKLGMTLAHTRISPEELSRTSEAFLTSTPHCMLPVTRFNQQPVGTGNPGPVFHRLIAAWSDAVGVDIVEQMRKGAKARVGS